MDQFWDQGDTISGALHSPASAAGFYQRVDNVHVANFSFPDPSASHSGYFENRIVIEALFRVIYRRDASFRHLTQPAPDKPYDYENIYLGPGERVLIGLVARLLELRIISYASFGLAVLAVISLLTGYLVSWFQGQRNAV